MAPSNSTHPDPNLSAMIRKSQEAIQRGRRLTQRTEELLRESRALLMNKPIVPWARQAKLKGIFYPNEPAES
jgi:hypothetical protein